MPPALCGYAAPVQLCGHSGEGFHPGLSYICNDIFKVRAEALSRYDPRGIRCGYVARAHLSESRIAKLYSAGFGGLQCGPGPLGDTLPLILSHGREDMDGQLVRVRVVYTHERNAGFHDIDQKRGVATKAVKLGDGVESPLTPHSSTAQLPEQPLNLEQGPPPSARGGDVVRVQCVHHGPL